MTVVALDTRRREKPAFVVQVFNGKRWAKVRGRDGGPWSTADRAEQVARSRENAERRSSSTEGLPHRVREAT